MRILHIHNEIENKGGTEVYLAQLQQMLPQRGFISYWIAIVESESGWKWCLENKSWKEESAETILAALKDWIIGQNIDLICLHNLFEDQFIDFITTLRPVVKFAHSPVIVCPGKDKYWRFSEMACTVPFGIHCFFHAYSQGCTNRHPKRLIRSFQYVKNEIRRSKIVYERVVVMSNYNYNLLLECHVPAEKIIVNPYFTDFIEIASPVEGLKHLLFVGRIISGKGVEHLINVMEQINKKNPELVLHIVGDGLMRPEMEELVRVKRLQDHILFKGWLSRAEIDRELKSCILLIFPSTYPEAFGISGIEAMMAGKPVVAFDVGGVSTWLRHGYNGYLGKAGDVREMYEYVENLLTDKQLYKRFCTNARQSAVERFLPNNHLEMLEALFMSINKKSKLSNSIQ